MRLTVLHPDPARGPGLVPTTVDVDPGLTVGRLRPHLARLTGWSGWSSASVRPAVHDLALDDTHRVGTFPLVPGCTLRPAPGPRGAAEQAVHGELHVAVTAGPDCGHLVPVRPGSEVTLVGRARPEPQAVLAVDDAAFVRVQVRARTRAGVPRRPGPVPRGSGVQVRVDGPASMTGGRRTRPSVRVGDQRADQVRAGQVRAGQVRAGQVRAGQVRAGRIRAGRWVRWREGAELRVGASVLVLRRRPAAGDVPGGTPRRRAPSAAVLVPLGASLLGGVALAATTHQPLLLLTALVGPATLLTGYRTRTGLPAGPEPADDPAAATTRDPAHLVAATVRALDGGDAARSPAPWDAVGTMAVVGPREAALAVARALLLGELGTHLSAGLVVRTADPEAWAWCEAVALEPRWPSRADPGTVVVVDAAIAEDVAAWRATSGPEHRLLLVLPSRAQVPAWCRAVVDARRHPHAVSRETAQAQLVRAAGVRSRCDGTEGGPGHAPTAAPAVPELPALVRLGDLPGTPEATTRAVAAAWAAGPAGLRTPLGSAPDLSPLVVDLVRDGPHALVAGTTGAGKSELLTTWVLGLATRHPPERLAILLVDFKGGTGLGAVADLPHVLDHVTDLDPAAARRVLVGLRAELHRRERLLAAHDARDVTDLAPDAADTPPRLLVVVDELRALVDDVPEALPALARLAAQGRALGVHLVLATQRPAGAVSADLRANVTLRVALRVADAADSIDVLDVPDAALLDAAAPGRALLRRGTSAPERLQVALPRDGRRDETARLVAGRHRSAWTPTSTAAPTAAPPDATARWVAAARQAAVGRPVRPVPWLPALPDTVHAPDVPPGTGPAVVLALADLPHEQRRDTVPWSPSDGNVLVLGGPGSGRTTTLLTVGAQALRAGVPVHAIGLPDDAADLLRGHDVHGLLGTVARADEASRVARLLELLAEPATTAGPAPTQVLLVDGLGTVLHSLARLARGAGGEPLTALWRDGGRMPGAVAVVAAETAAGAANQHAQHARYRLVLRADAGLDASAGVPSAFGGSRTVPGRAVLVGPDGPVLCQVVLPPADRPRGAAAARGPGGTTRPPRVARLPEHVRLPAGLPSESLGPPVGVGDDTARTLHVQTGAGLLVAGPSASGRSTVLAVLAAGLVHAGRRVVRVVDGVTPVERLPGVVDVPVDAAAAHPAFGTATVAALGPDASGPDGASPDGAGVGGWTVLVDDLDELLAPAPHLADLLAVRCRTGCDLVVSATSSAVVGAFRGPLAAMLRRRRLLVLDLSDPASAELAGPRAARLADPARRVAGRGALVQGRTTTPVQVYDLRRDDLAPGADTSG